MGYCGIATAGLVPSGTNMMISKAGATPTKHGRTVRYRYRSEHHLDIVSHAALHTERNLLNLPGTIDKRVS